MHFRDESNAITIEYISSNLSVAATIASCPLTRTPSQPLRHHTIKNLRFRRTTALSLSISQHMGLSSYIEVPPTPTDHDPSTGRFGAGRRAATYTYVCVRVPLWVRCGFFTSPLHDSSTGASAINSRCAAVVEKTLNLMASVTHKSYFTDNQ